MRLITTERNVEIFIFGEKMNIYHGASLEIEGESVIVFSYNKGVMMSEDMKAELERLRAENEALKNKKARTGAITMKVSEKGALSIYGMGRFPVTLYKEQWVKLLAVSDEIKKFIAENEAQLKTKE